MAARGAARGRSRVAAIEWVAMLTCRSCKAPLTRRNTRCRACGWAVEYNPETSWRERQVVLGISLVVVGIALAVAFVLAFVHVKLP